MSKKREFSYYHAKFLNIQSFLKLLFAKEMKIAIEYDVECILLKLTFRFVNFAPSG